MSLNPKRREPRPRRVIKRVPAARSEGNLAGLPSIQMQVVTKYLAGGMVEPQTGCILYFTPIGL